MRSGSPGESKTRIAAGLFGAIALVAFSLSCGGGAASPVAAPAGTAVLTVSPASLSFGNQPVGTMSTAQSITLTNSGAGVVQISGIEITGPNPGDFVEANTCANSLGTGASCAVAVSFAPVAAGTIAAVLDVSTSTSPNAQSVSISGIGNHDVLLEWAASPTAGVSGYNVYRGTTPGGENPTPLNNGLVDATSYADETIVSGATYYYTVKAVGANGVSQSPASNETVATAP